MDGDTYTNMSNNSSNEIAIKDESNFFINSLTPLKADILNHEEPLRHINDYDSNILKEDAYNDVSDEVLKLEYKISKVEEELNNIDERISSAMEIKDYILADNLQNRKIQLENDLKDLIKIYKEASISARISGGISSKFKQKFDGIKNSANNILNTFLSKMPGKLSKIIEIKNSLSKLESINKNVDALMSRKYPYGEAEARYNQLSKYIAKANSIHAEISRFIK